MTPVIPSSVGNISLIPGNAFLPRKDNRSIRFSVLGSQVNCTALPQRFILPLPMSLTVFPKLRYALHHKHRSPTLSATGTDVTMEEQDPSVVEEDSGGLSESTPSADETSNETSVKPESSSTPAQARRSRSPRKSEMPPIKNEELIPGSTFTGKVRSIQPFGAFVDFGAFTDGLIHVSQLSDRFVKDVGNVVSVGQEVKVRLLEANMETERISLTMRESDDTDKLQQRKDAPPSGDKSRPPRKSAVAQNQKRDEMKKTSKFVKGQDLKGTVKNLTRSGAFISLPEGEEGFLPASEESDDGFVNMMGGSSLQAGQEVEVRVLRISRGQVTLTMKKEEDLQDLDAEITQGVVHSATNPFVLAFQKNMEIAAFLNSREKLGTQVTSSVDGAIRTTVEEAVVNTEASAAEGSESSVGLVAEAAPPVDIEIPASESDSSITEEKEQIEKSEILYLVDDEVSGKEKEAGLSPGENEPTEESQSSVGSVAEAAPPVDVESPVGSVAEAAPPVDIEIPDGELDSSTTKEKGQIEKSEILDVVDDEVSGKEKKAGLSSGENKPNEESQPSVGSVVEAAPPVDVESPVGSVAEAASPVDVKIPESVSDSSITKEKEQIEKSEILDVVNDEISGREKEAGPSSGENKPIEESQSSVGSVAEAASPVDVEISESESDSSITEEKEKLEKPEILDVVDNEVSGKENEARPSSSENEPTEGSQSSMGLVSEETPLTDESKSKEIPESSGETTSQLLPSEDQIAKETDSESESAIAQDKEQIEKHQFVDVVDHGVSRKENESELSADENGSVIGSDVQTDVSTSETKADEVDINGTSDVSGIPTDGASLSSDSQGGEEAEEIKLESAKSEQQELISSVDPTDSSGVPVENEHGEAAVVENVNMTVSSENVGASLPNDSVAKASISPALVKQLREETGAGMMDCKKALSESGGDIVKAQQFLRKKGLASAEKKASRATAEGRIGSYVHDSRIGVLVEVNCETDFVSRGDIFKELVEDLAMQVAACPQVQYLKAEDVPEDIVNKEKEIEMQKEDLLSKPEQIREKIVGGRIKKRLDELALLEQPYIKNDKIVIKDLVKQTIATIGENIKVRRFVRYNLGEGLEKKSQDFAAEVAAQTTAKSQTPPKQWGPVAAKADETVQKQPSVAVSAALVKQLREETGAGMMDCKKALSETGGNLEKAQEYLRKKGLSAADKKSSRLAAEGRIGCYIHDSRIGVLIEVNCETDFVGRSEKFKELVDDLAMQVVACPQVEFVSIEEIPEDIAKKEKEIEMQREVLQSKPENIRERIVEGRILKRLGELALLEQPFIKNDTLLVKDLVKQTVAALGENIKVRRFVRFTLGEKSEDVKGGEE